HRAGPARRHRERRGPRAVRCRAARDERRGRRPARAAWEPPSDASLRRPPRRWQAAANGPAPYRPERQRYITDARNAARQAFDARRTGVSISMKAHRNAARIMLLRRSPDEAGTVPSPVVAGLVAAVWWRLRLDGKR